MDIYIVNLGMTPNFKSLGQCQAWWHTPVISAIGRQRQANFWVRGQPGLQSKFQDSQDYREKPCCKQTKKQKQTNKKNKQKHGTDHNYSWDKVWKIFLFGFYSCKGWFSGFWSSKEQEHLCISIVIIKHTMEKANYNWRHQIRLTVPKSYIQ